MNEILQLVSYGALSGLGLCLTGAAFSFTVSSIVRLFERRV